MSAGLSFIVLNVLRFLTILSLMLVCVSSMLVINFQAKDGFGKNFFGIMAGVAQIGSAIALIATELPIPFTQRFIHQRAPVLSQGHSLAWSGVPMLTLATSVLSNLRSSLLTTEATGSTVHTVILSAGTSIGVLGILYTLMPFVYWNAPSGECRRLR